MRANTWRRIVASPNTGQKITATGHPVDAPSNHLRVRSDDSYAAAASIKGADSRVTLAIRSPMLSRTASAVFPLSANAT